MASLLSRPASHGRNIASSHDEPPRHGYLHVARKLAPAGRELRGLYPAGAVTYLRNRTADLGEKALDMHRQAVQAMPIHISRRLPEDERLTVVCSDKPRRRTGRAYTTQQVRMIAGTQRAHNALASEITHAAGLRAHELFTLARPDEQPPHRRPASRGVPRTTGT